MGIEGRTHRGIKDFLYRYRKTLILIIIVVTITVISNVAIAVWLYQSHDITIPTVGTIHLTGVEAYGGDIKLVDGVDSIDWGSIYAGSPKNVSFYLRSLSNIPITLAFSADHWEPEGLESFALISWNYTGTQISPREEISVRIDFDSVLSNDFIDFLLANHDIAFRFNLNIRAVET